MPNFECASQRSSAGASRLGYEFCYPLPTGDRKFYVAFEKGSSDADVQASIEAAFGKDSFERVQVVVKPNDLPANNEKVFDVSNLVSPFISAKLWKQESVPGPNCFQAAMAAAGLLELAGRYVHEDEFSYFLSKRFEPISCSAAPAGAVAVYYSGHLSGGSTGGFYNAGDHAASILPAGLVFQKGCFRDSCYYRIVPASKAMSSIEVFSADPFSGPPSPEKDSDYSMSCYNKLENGSQKNFPENAKLNAVMKKFFPVIAYYVQLFDAAKNKSWADYHAYRVPLLAVENTWAVMKKFGNAMDAVMEGAGVLLYAQPKAAEAYLKLESLQFQNDAMAQKFWPFPDRWSENKREEELKKLYREKYIHPDGEEFKQEVLVHLEFMNVPAGLREEVFARVLKRVKAYDPESFAASNGANGIPFFKILEEEVSAVVN